MSLVKQPQTTEETGFCGSGLVREGAVRPMKVQRLKCSIRGQTERRPVRSHDARCLLRDSATSKT